MLKIIRRVGKANMPPMRYFCVVFPNREDFNNAEKRLIGVGNVDRDKEQNKHYAMIKHGYREDIVNNPDYDNYFDAETGELNWKEYAPNDGAVVGSKESYELQPGDKLVRYDTLDGSYIAPADTKYEELGLPYDESKVQKTYWEVDKSFTVEKSEVAPTICSEGGGTQYRLNSNEGRISEYNEEHNWDGEFVPEGSYRDSPSNLAYDGFIHKIDESEAIGKNQNLKEDTAVDAKQTNNMGSFREMLQQAREEHIAEAQMTAGTEQEGQSPPEKDISQSPVIPKDNEITR